MYGYYGYGLYDPTMILVLIGAVLSLWASAKVKNTFNRYSSVRSMTGMTGAEAAQRLLNSQGIYDVTVRPVSGQLTDHYDPKNDVMRLSSEVYSGTSIASVSIAAHESGHAIQDGTSYAFLRFRSAIAPVVSLVSVASWPLILIGLAIIWAGNQTTGNMIFDLGILFFAAVVLFHTVTLPVELNASKRAIRQLVDLRIIEPAETAGAKKVLSAAAMTYVAALATAVANLIRILMIRGRD